MLSFHGLLGKWFSDKFQYGWELTIFHKMRSYSDGLTLFNLEMSSSKCLEFDHNPRWEFWLVIANYTIIEFNIYNTDHAEEGE